MDEYTENTFNSIREDVNNFAQLLCRARVALEALRDECLSDEDGEEVESLLSDIDEALGDWEE